MSDNERKAMVELDEIAEKSGGYVSPLFKDNVHYDYRKILAYCRERKMDPRDLKIKELDQFLVK